MGKVFLRYLAALLALLLLTLEAGVARFIGEGYSLAEIPEALRASSLGDVVAATSRPLRPKVSRGADQEKMPRDLQVLLEERSADYSVYYLRPDLEIEPFLYNSRAQQPASMIKLFVMAKVMEEVREGRMTLEEPVGLRREDVVGGAGKLTIYDLDKTFTVRELLELMIDTSDNTATNALITKLGMTAINDYLSKEGYFDTKLNHKMMLQKVETTQKVGKRTKKVITTQADNTSSVKDVGRLLTRIYKHECVGVAEDDVMLEILKKQEDKICFNAALPDWQIAHKTGEISGLFHDGGIFYGPDGNFVLVIFCEHYAGRQIAIEDMQEMAWYFAARLTDMMGK